MLVHLILVSEISQAVFTFFLFIFFSIFCSAAVIYTTLSSSSFICSSASVILLLIPSSVLVICLFVLQFFWSLVNISCLFLIFGSILIFFFPCLPLFPKILDHLHYHYSKFFFWKVALIQLFFCGFISSIHLDFLVFHCD